MDNQIEEITKIIVKNIYGSEQYVGYASSARNAAKELFSIGYRKAEDIYEDLYEGKIEIIKKGSNDKLKKASDVAREIFADIKRAIEEECDEVRKEETGDVRDVAIDYLTDLYLSLETLEQKYGVEEYEQTD